MDKPNRKNIRLKGWDYSTNACYHVTICAKDRKCIFGQVKRTGDIERPYEVEFTPLGSVCNEAISGDAGKNPAVSIENFVVMPNHVHILVWIKRGEAKPVDLSSFVKYLKSKVTRAARVAGIQAEIWQKGYYERIIRNDEDFFGVWEYIDANPAKWDDDPYHC